MEQEERATYVLSLLCVHCLRELSLQPQEVGAIVPIAPEPTWGRRTDTTAPVLTLSLIHISEPTRLS